MRCTRLRCGVWPAATTAVVAAASCVGPHRPATPLPSAAPATRPDVYGPGDLLQVRVQMSSDPAATTVMTARVQADGTLALTGPPDLAAAGLDRAALTEILTRIYSGMGGPPMVDVRRLQVAGAERLTPGPIGTGDLVRCEVYGLGVVPGQPTVIVQRVSTGGTIQPPLIGPVRVAGRTDGRAADAVTAAYRAANILSTAQVYVLTLERAPADAADKSLPDGPVDPVPPLLRELYLPR